MIKKEPRIKVGIMSSESVDIEFTGSFSCAQLPDVPTKIRARATPDGQVCIGMVNAQSILFEPSDEKSDWFELIDVAIGIGYHWERHQQQRFRGSLMLIAKDGMVIVINEVGVESYLQSVISSEMSASSPVELLKAHSVISRSWLLAQISHRAKDRSDSSNKQTQHTTGSDDGILIRWWDREDHDLFDVCADDHCQRYQGITRLVSTAAAEAVISTCGQVLMSGTEIVDARFSKCCGGVSEEFEACWDDAHRPYLEAVGCNPNGAQIPDLTDEETATEWILSNPEAFCNTYDSDLISIALNDYDQETRDFYRWRIEYSQRDLRELIAKRTGLDFGDIIDLVPISRGKSGRIVRLKIIGTRRTLIIGKELMIRRALSPSHLYSSAFVVRKPNVVNGIPQQFTIVGAGWGHGVGLCQIGAAVMAQKGYGYKEILLHYYRNVKIEQIY